MRRKVQIYRKGYGWSRPSRGQEIARISYAISYAFIPCVPYVTMANTVVLVVSITIIASSVAIYKVFFLTRCVVH